MCEPMGMIYTFDTLKPKEIFQKICSIVGNNQDVTINEAKTTTSIFFYGEKMFSIGHLPERILDSFFVFIFGSDRIRFQNSCYMYYTILATLCHKRNPPLCC